jgi:lysophospholipase L1-like esterase
MRPVVTAPAIGGAMWALVRWELRVARGGPRPYEHALPGDALIGADGRRPVRIAWLGDSLATGLGVDHVADTPAHLVARMLERPVDVGVLAVPGARACHVLEEQLPRLRGDEDLVVLCVGANDVAGSTGRARYAEQLDAALAALAPRPTILLSLPDMGMADRLPQPLRGIAGAGSRWFDAARRRVAARHPHVHSVDIASRPATLSRREGRRMLCADRFHPGPEGYRVWAERIADASHAVLGMSLADGQPFLGRSL